MRSPLVLTVHRFESYTLSEYKQILRRRVDRPVTAIDRRRWPSRVFGTVLAVVAAAGCNVAADAPDVASVQTAGLSATIDSLVETAVNSDGPGAGVLVVYDGVVRHAQGYGLADVEQGIPIRPSTAMRMASVSKQFTAMAVMVAAEEGLVSLDDPVTQYFDAPVYEGITIRHLLHHTSGLAAYADVFEDEWDRSRVVENDDVIGWYTRANPAPFFAPGDGWRYSNGGYSLLSSIVAKVSGMTFAEYARSRIFEPLEMRNSLFFNLAAPEPIPNRAFAYAVDDNGTVRRVDGHYMNGVLGEGGLYTTLLDYANWDAALRNTRLVSASMLDQAFVPATLNDGRIAVRPRDGAPTVGYGFGWEVSLEDARREVRHGGGWHGTRTHTIRALDDGYTIAVFMNRDDLTPSDTAREIEAALRDWAGLE